jgi:hypothetical protein
VPSLPQLFKDVIYLCRQLGLYYLWIDSLCIVQDDLKDLGDHRRYNGIYIRECLHYDISRLGQKYRSKYIQRASLPPTSHLKFPLFMTLRSSSEDSFLARGRPQQTTPEKMRQVNFRC